ncbi:MAG: hypothetical protein ACF8LL_01925 [Phycisphaerales bacterium]
MSTTVSVALAAWCLNTLESDVAHAPTIAEMARGNPASIRALAALHSSGGAADLELPPSWRTTIERVLESGTWESRVALAAVVLFEPLTVADAGRVLDRSDLEIADVISFWSRRGCVTWGAGGVETRHPVLAAALKKCLGEPVLRVVADRGGAAGLSVTAMPQWPQAAMPLMVMRDQREPEASAQRALSEGALGEAEGLFKLAMQVRPTPHEGPLLEGAGLCKLRLCKLGEGVALLQSAEAWYRSSGDAPAACRVLVRRLDAESELGRTGHREVARQLTEIFRRVWALGEWSAVLDALEALVRVWERSGQTNAIAEVLDDVANHLHLLQPRERCRAAMLLTLGVFFGQPGDGLHQARQACKIAARVGDMSLRIKSQHRLYVALVLRGLGATAEASETYGFIARHLDAIADVPLRYSALSNRAVWLMEMGAYGMAQETLHRARLTLPRSATGEKLNYLLNVGECALRSGDDTRALGAFQAAEKQLSAGSRDHLRDVTMAGLGLTAIRTGDLEEARRASLALREWPTWYFDPTLIVEFRLEWLRRVGRASEGLGYLEEVCGTLRGRYLGAWLRMEVLRGRVARRSGTTLDREVVKDAISAALDLNLSNRAAELERLLNGR